MALPHDVILIQELMQGEQDPVCVCANSYVAVAYLEREATDRGIPLDVRHTNKHYAIGSHEYGFTELRLYDMAWLRQQEAKT